MLHNRLRFWPQPLVRSSLLKRRRPLKVMAADNQAKPVRDPIMRWSCIYRRVRYRAGVNRLCSFSRRSLSKPMIHMVEDLQFQVLVVPRVRRRERGANKIPFPEKVKKKMHQLIVVLLTNRKTRRAKKMSLELCKIRKMPRDRSPNTKKFSKVTWIWRIKDIGNFKDLVLDSWGKVYMRG